MKFLRKGGLWRAHVQGKGWVISLLLTILLLLFVCAIVVLVVTTAVVASTMSMVVMVTSVVSTVWWRWRIGGGERRVGSALTMVFWG